MKPDIPLVILGGVALVSIIGASCVRGRWRDPLAAIAAASFTAEAVIRGEHGDWLAAGIYGACVLILVSGLGAKLRRYREENKEREGSR